MTLFFLLENYASISPATGDGSEDVLELPREGDVEEDIESASKAAEKPNQIAHSDFSKLMKGAKRGSLISGFAATGIGHCTVLYSSVTLCAIITI
jgi:hypothetical protein